jgi:hypothetical protein
VKKGHKLKNIESRILGLVGYEVDFDGEYIFQGNISSKFKVMGKMHILLNTKYKKEGA